MSKTKDEVFDQVKQTLVRILKINDTEVSPDSKVMDDLGADSVDIWDIAASLEKIFLIKVQKGDVEKIETVSDVVSLVRQKVER